MANEHIREVTKMIRLIDAERFNRILQGFEGKLLECGKTEGAEAVKTIIKGLKTEPTVDAVEVVHGRWERIDKRYVEMFKCSICRSECYVPTCMGEPMYDYCPNCGADMRERNKE